MSRVSLHPHQSTPRRGWTSRPAQLAHAGFDSLVVDLEHGPIDLATAHAMIAATAGTPAVPYARLPANLPWLAKPLLDAGVLGVIFPLARSPDDAAAAVRAARYPPRGE